MNKLMNDGGDCRTAPATPGLLKISKYLFVQKQLEEIVGQESVW